MTTRFKDHILTAGLLSARPAATAVPAGSLYPATDTDIIYRSDGATWADWDKAVFVGCQVKRIAYYQMVSAAVTAIPWDGEEYDTHGFHDNVTNNTRLTVPTGQAGIYLVTGAWVPDATIAAGTRALIRVFKNGVEVLGSELEGGGVNASPVISGFVQLAVSDYVQLSYFLSGAAKDLYAPSTRFAIQKVGVL